MRISTKDYFNKLPKLAATSYQSGRTVVDVFCSFKSFGINSRWRSLKTLNILLLKEIFCPHMNIIMLQSSSLDGPLTKVDYFPKYIESFSRKVPEA